MDRKVAKYAVKSAGGDGFGEFLLDILAWPAYLHNSKWWLVAWICWQTRKTRQNKYIFAEMALRLIDFIMQIFEKYLFPTKFQVNQ